MARNFRELKESLYILKSNVANSRTMWNRWWVAPKLNNVQQLPESSRNVHKMFFVGQIGNKIYNGNLSLISYKRYLIEAAANNMDDLASIHQVM
jgi:hypothetical protein